MKLMQSFIGFLLMRKLVQEKDLKKIAGRINRPKNHPLNWLDVYLNPDYLKGVFPKTQGKKFIHSFSQFNNLSEGVKRLIEGMLWKGLYD